MSRMQMGNDIMLSTRKYGGAIGPFAQTVVAPDAATEGVDMEEDAVIHCIVCLASDDRKPHNA